jgi:Zn-dependent protease with chaperone function
VLAHELAHLVREDNVWLAGAAVIEGPTKGLYAQKWSSTVDLMMIRDPIDTGAPSTS